jgi:hypothetical protein
MRVLVGQNHLHTLGGTETFTYTLVKYLKKLNFKVDVVTLKTGIMSDKIKSDFPDVGINEGVKKYDLALINHNKVVEFVRKQSIQIKTLVQTCHGTIPDLEQPCSNADIHVSISEEVKKHLKIKGFDSEVIYNGIDLEKYQMTQVPNDYPETIVSLTQSFEANNILSKVSNKIGSNLISFNKNFNPIIDINEALQKADLVFGLGRSAYEGMATGSNVFIWDIREYNGNKGDGFITYENLHELMRFNSSGRRYNKKYNVDQLVDEIESNYCATDCLSNRYAVERYLNMEKQVNKYVELALK